MDPYKIRVRVGDNEFDGEGPVETDYQQWLVVIANRATQEPLRNSERAETNGSTDKQTDGVDQKLLSEIFISDEATGEVSLRSLPPGENGNRAADAALLLMFGHSKIHGLAEVPVT